MVLIVLALIMGGVIISIYKGRFPLFRYIMGVVSIMYIGLVFSRPDDLLQPNITLPMREI